MWPIFISLIQLAFISLTLVGLSAWAHRSLHISEHSALVVAAAIYAALSMAQFWIAWAFLPLRWPSTLLTLAICIPMIAAGVRAVREQSFLHRISWPMGLYLAATVILLLWVHAVSGDISPLREAANRWTHSLPGDNAIPLDFARGFAEGVIPTPLHATWLSSDRPPLQTAMFMLTPGFLIAGADLWAYQAAGVAFQLLILIAAWALAMAMTDQRRIAIVSVAALFFTPIVLVNGAYVWPKLLAATFVNGAITLYFYSDKSVSKKTVLYGPLLGLLAALAMLSHGGTVFVAIGIIPLVLLRPYRVGIRTGMIAVSVSASMLAPWILYQTFADPPGNRLVKWHLAGVEVIDDRTVPEALIQAYENMPIQAQLRHREANLNVLLKAPWSVNEKTWDAIAELKNQNRQGIQEILREIRKKQFFYMTMGMGFLGLTLYLLPLYLLDPQTRIISLTALMSLTVWVLLKFPAGSTTIHQGSLYPPIVIILLALTWLGMRSITLMIAVACVHIILTIFIYLI